MSPSKRCTEDFEKIHPAIFEGLLNLRISEMAKPFEQKIQCSPATVRSSHDSGFQSQAEVQPLQAQAELDRELAELHAELLESGPCTRCGDPSHLTRCCIYSESYNPRSFGMFACKKGNAPFCKYTWLSVDVFPMNNDGCEPCPKCRTITQPKMHKLTIGALPHIAKLVEKCFRSQMERRIQSGKFQGSTQKAEQLIQTDTTNWLRDNLPELYTKQTAGAASGKRSNKSRLSPFSSKPFGRLSSFVHVETSYAPEPQNYFCMSAGSDCSNFASRSPKFDDSGYNGSLVASPSGSEKSLDSRSGAKLRSETSAFCEDMMNSVVSMLYDV